MSCSFLCIKYSRAHKSFSGGNTHIIKAGKELINIPAAGGKYYKEIFNEEAVMKDLKNKKPVNYVLMCAFAFLWIAAMVQYIGSQNKSVPGVAGVFAGERLENKSFVITCRGEVDNEYHTAGEKEVWLKSCAGILNIPQGGEISVSRGDDTSILAYEMKGPKAEAQLKLITRETLVSPEEMSMANYMDFYISVADVLDKAADYRRELSGICDSMGMDAQITTIFCGEIRGQLSEDDMRSVGEAFLEKLSARECSCEFTGGSMNMYAYSQDAGEYIVSDGKKINVNLIMTYDEIRNITDVYVCSPVNI